MCAFMLMSVCMCICICVSVCMYACVYMSCVIYLVLFSPDKTVGLFWMNAAETWIDISSATAGQVGP